MNICVYMYIELTINKLTDEAALPEEEVGDQ